MVRILFLALTLFSASLALASGVKVTSFKFVDSNNRLSPVAEICGELIIPSGKSEMIKIISDPASKGPASYYTWAGKEGSFCHIIATYTGKADVDLAQ